MTMTILHCLLRARLLAHEPDGGLPAAATHLQEFSSVSSPSLNLVGDDIGDRDHFRHTTAWWSGGE